MPTVATNKLYKTAFADPAGGTNTLLTHAGTRSRASIVVVGQDDLERIFILEAWAKRLPPDQLMAKMFETQFKWKPAIFGMDSSGPQLQFHQIVKKEARDRNIHWNLRGVAERTDKITFIETVLQPIVAQGRLLRSAVEHEVADLKNEWQSFPGGSYKDIMDALARAVWLLPSSLPAHLRLMDRMQLKRYLERTGMDSSQVELRLAQHAELTGLR
jgi:predicted phage terminase large subunit-like protein